MKHSRNTPTTHRCTACQGTGAVMAGKSSYYDLDDQIGCSACGSSGMVEHGPHDPIRSLAYLRTYSPDGFMWSRYLDVRAKVTAPVRLP